MVQARPWPIIRAGLVFLVFVPIATWLLKDIYGFVGAAYAIFAGKWIVGLICLYSAGSYLEKIPWEAFLKPMLAGAAMGIVLSQAHLEGMLLNLLTGALVYSTGLLIFNFQKFQEFSRHPRLQKALSRWRR